jgi:hypothetical protein
VQTRVPGAGIEFPALEDAMENGDRKNRGKTKK